MPTVESASKMLWLLSAAVLGAMAAIMLIAWAYGLARRNGGWTDVFWTFGSGFGLAGAALAPPEGADWPQARQWLVAALVLAWALRLGSYLIPRVAHHEDPRYAKF